MRARRTTTPLLAAAVSGLLLLTACSSSADDSTSATDSEPKERAADDVDIEGATAQLEEFSEPFAWQDPGPAFDASGAEGSQVVYIPVDNKIPMMGGVIYPQIEAALATAGVETSLCDGKGAPDQWVACIDDSAGRGADVLILDSFPVAAVSEAVERARAQGVKIIDANNGDPGEVPEGADASVSFQYSLSGKLVSDWIIKDSGGDANILLIRSPEVGNVPALVDRGYIAELEEKCPTTCKYKIVDVSVADWATKLQSTVQSQLAADPSIDYVVPIFDGMSTYVVPGIQAAGAADRVKVATFNANLDPMKKMAAGESIFVDIGSHSPYEGWAQADQALRLLVGEPPLDNELVPARVFTRESIGDLELTEDAERTGEWFGDNSYEEEYKRLWGVD